MFLQHDGKEDHKPVSHQSEEILEDEEQGVSSCDRTHEEDDGVDSDPDVAGDRLPHSAQCLKIQCGSICTRNRVGTKPQCDDHRTESAESPQAVVTRQYERSRRYCVCCSPAWVAGDSASQADCEEVDKDESDAEASEGHHEDLQFGDPLGIIDEEISAGSCPGDRHRELEHEERKAICGNSGGIADGSEAGVEMWTCRADEDEEDESLGYPCPSGKTSANSASRRADLSRDSAQGLS